MSQLIAHLPILQGRPQGVPMNTPQDRDYLDAKREIILFSFLFLFPCFIRFLISTVEFVCSLQQQFMMHRAFQAQKSLFPCPLFPIPNPIPKQTTRQNLSLGCNQLQVCGVLYQPEEKIHNLRYFNSR